MKNILGVSLMASPFIIIWGGLVFFGVLPASLCIKVLGMVFCMLATVACLGKGISIVSQPSSTKILK